MRDSTSVTGRIKNFLLLIMFLAGLIASITVFITLEHQHYANLFKTAGQIRSQSSIILYDMQYFPKEIPHGLKHHYEILTRPVFKNLTSEMTVSYSIKKKYTDLLSLGKILKKRATYNDLSSYHNQLLQYIYKTNNFLDDIEDFNAYKNRIIFFSILFLMLTIISIVAYLSWLMRYEIIKPLQRLILASTQIEKKQFHHISLDTKLDNEIGCLNITFTQMAQNLGTFYEQLEEKVNDKTKKLTQLNHDLQVLYHCSDLISARTINPKLLRDFLQKLYDTNYTNYVSLECFNNEAWVISIGEKNHLPTQEKNLTFDDENLGVLVWQLIPTQDNYVIFHNVSQMLVRALYFHKLQQKKQYLLLMEERSIIARELHDSLAQVLSYLKIQLSLLKIEAAKCATPKGNVMEIIQDFEQALTTGYQQLRELLATFRLTVQETDLQSALQEVVNSLQNQTNIQMTVSCNIPPQVFNAQELIHILQIIREAILNAIKHSQAKNILVNASINSDGEYELTVQDNGVGIATLDEPDGHYGLNIMSERAARIHSQLTISNVKPHGTLVRLVFNR